jgi:hypothetical protein
MRRLLKEHTENVPWSMVGMIGMMMMRRKLRNAVSVLPAASTAKYGGVKQKTRI